MMVLFVPLIVLLQGLVAMVNVAHTYLAKKAQTASKDLIFFSQRNSLLLMVPQYESQAKACLELVSSTFNMAYL